MTSGSSQPICLLSAVPADLATGWREYFERCIENAGLRPVEYSASAVDGATCLLASPRGSDEVAYQIAYAMGRGLRGLVIRLPDEDLSRYDPRPPSTVPMAVETPDGPAEAEPKITAALREILQSPVGGTPKRPQQTDNQMEWASRPADQPLTVATVEQAEQLFRKFRPHVVHFSGHSNDDLIVFENERDELHEGVIVTARAFAAAVKATDDPPLLVLLNSCRSAAAGAAELLQIRRPDL